MRKLSLLLILALVLATLPIVAGAQSTKTRIIDRITDAGGNPRTGKVTFILTRKASSPTGIIPVGATVSASLDASGRFDISVYPSSALSPAAYYQVWYVDNSGRSELIGIYNIPALSTITALAPYRVTDTNLAAQYTFASPTDVNALITQVSNSTLAQLTGVTHADGKVQIFKSVSGTFEDSGITDNGSTVTIARPTGITGNTTVTGNISASGTAAVTGNITSGGNVTASTFTGDGSGLTGIASGTGGVTNTGSTTIGADTDVNGVGKISLQTGGVERIGVEADGTVAMPGQVTVFGCGGTDDSTRLSAAVSTASGGWVIIPNGQTCAGSDVTIPNLRVERGGLIKPVTSHSITISGTFDAGVYQAFTNATASQGTVSITGSLSRPMVPQWWGAKADGTTDDKLALNAAFAQSERDVFLPKGSYKTTVALTVPVCASIVGAGRDQATLVPTSAVTTFVLKVKSVTTMLANFGIDGAATTGATGIIFGDAHNFDSWGGHVSSVRTKNFIAGTGMRVADVVAGVFDHVQSDGNGDGLVTQQLCAAPDTCGFPTTTTFHNSRFLSNSGNGLKLVDGHSITFDGGSVESNDAEGALLLPGTSGTLEDIHFNGTWFEKNYESDPTKYQVRAGDGTALGSATIRPTFRDVFFDQGSAAKSILLDGAAVAGFVLDNVQVPNTAGTIKTSNHSYGVVINWARNVAVTALDNAARTGTTPTEGAEFHQGPAIAWTPVFASNLGNAATTFSGSVTVDKARFQLVGKYLTIWLRWHATLNAVTPTYISITLPTGLQSQSNVEIPTGATMNNGMWELGHFQMDGGNLLLQYRESGSGTYTSAGSVGGELVTTLELQ
jgi:hypothetical protein